MFKHGHGEIERKYDGFGEDDDGRDKKQGADQGAFVSGVRLWNGIRQEKVLLRKLKRFTGSIGIEDECKPTLWTDGLSYEK